jgi:hypothetical protein
MSDSTHMPSAPRPKRILTASSKLLDSSNTAAPSLSSHKQAIEARRRAIVAADRATDRDDTASVLDRMSTPPQSSSPPGTDFQGDHNANPTLDSDSEVEELPNSESYLSSISMC